MANCLQEGRALTFTDVRRSAFVAYGGLLGFVLVYRLVTGWIIEHRQTFAHLTVQMDTLAIVIPLFHGIARFGCLFAGCCYGKEWHGFLAVHYILPDGSERWCFPVQLLEAVCLFLLCLWYAAFVPKSGFRGNWSLSIWPVTPCAGSAWNFCGATRYGACMGYFLLASLSSMGLLVALALWGGWYRYRGRHAPKPEEESVCKS